MTKADRIYQPGTILHGVIVGAFRASGTSFEAWCNAHGVNTSVARGATYGQAGGEIGRALLERIIDAAGREMVELGYTQRMQAEAERLSNRGAA